MGRTEEALKRVSPLAGVPEDRYVAVESRGPRPLETYEAEARSERFDPGELDKRHPSDTGTAAGDSASSTESPADNDKIIDVRQLAQYGGFVARAIARHKAIVALTFILMVGATAAAARLWPKTYHVQVSVLAQRNDLMASLSNPGRMMPAAGDSPGRTAAQIIKRHDNLVAVVKQTDLLNEWERTRPPLLQFKDRVFRLLFATPSEEERTDAFVGLLERRIVVSVSEEGVIAIDVDWGDPRMAYELASTCLQNFIDTRRVGELSSINEAISILERSATSLQGEIDATATELQSNQPAHSRPRPRSTSVAASRAIAAALPPTTSAMVVQSIAGAPPEALFELARLKSALDAKRQEVARFEEARRQQVADAQGRLDAALTMYTEDHPSVTSLRQTLASLSRESSELTAARTQAQALELRYDTASRAAQEQQAQAQARADAAARPPDPDVRRPLPAPSDPEVNPVSPPSTSLAGVVSEGLDPVSLRLRLQLGQLANIRDRINAARIELATSQASFQYRYAVMRPPQVPRRPIKPNVLAVLLAGMIGAIVLALGAAVLVDLLSGRLLEPWQLERAAGVPILARLRRL